MKLSTMSNVDIPQVMLENDPFSRWLGIEILECDAGNCQLGMHVREDMLNGLGVAHGGVVYALADSALAFISNCGGRKAYSIETSINHIETVTVGDYLVASCIIDETKRNVGFHIIEVRCKEKRVALFKGVVYRTKKEWNL